MLTVSLALSAAVLIGTGDFLAGLLSRHSSVPTVLLTIYVVSFLGAVTLAAVTTTPPRAHYLLIGLATGLCSGIGLLLLYNALALGPMSIVAPISATAVAIPITVGLLGGDRLVGAQPAGMALALCGVGLISMVAGDHPAHGNVKVALALAVAATVALGVTQVAVRATADAGPLWGLAAIRFGGAMVLACVAVLRPSSFRRADRSLWLPVAGAALLNAVAQGLLLVANRHGSLSIIATLMSLYPLATIVLATLVLRERLRPLQALGIASALAGVALLSWT